MGSMEEGADACRTTSLAQTVRRVQRLDSGFLLLLEHVEAEIPEASGLAESCRVILLRLPLPTPEVCVASESALFSATS